MSVSVASLGAPREIRAAEGSVPPSMVVAGSRLVVGYGSGHLRAFDLDTGAEVWRSTRPHTDWITDLALRPDGLTVASASRDGTVVLWDVADGRQVGRMEGHESWVFGVVWSPDGTRLASASDDGTCRLWSPGRAEALRAFRHHQTGVYAIDWSTDGALLASGDVSGDVVVWQAWGGREVARVNIDDVVWRVAWRPGHHRLAIGSGRSQVGVWTPGDGGGIELLPHHGQSAPAVAWSPEGGVLASAGWDGTLRLCPASGGAPLVSAGFMAGAPWRLTFAGDGRHVVSSHPDGVVLVWEVELLEPGAALA